MGTENQFGVLQDDTLPPGKVVEGKSILKGLEDAGADSSAPVNSENPDKSGFFQRPKF